MGVKAPRPGSVRDCGVNAPACLPPAPRVQGGNVFPPEAQSRPRARELNKGSKGWRSPRAPAPRATQGTAARASAFDHGLHIQREEAHWESQTENTPPPAGKGHR